MKILLLDSDALQSSWKINVDLSGWSFAPDAIDGKQKKPIFADLKNGRDPHKHLKMVKIRLARRGRKKLAMYDVVVADARAPRDGRFIEKLGTYNPLTNPALIELNEERAFHWVMNGAQPTDTVKTMLSNKGIMLRKHLQIGVAKGALSQDEAEKRLNEWKQAKEAKIKAKTDKLSEARQVSARARKEAETKVKEARAEAIRKKAEAAAAAPQEAAAPAEGEQPAAENAEGQA